MHKDRLKEMALTNGEQHLFLHRFLHLFSAGSLHSPAPLPLLFSIHFTASTIPNSLRVLQFHFPFAKFISPPPFPRFPHFACLHLHQIHNATSAFPKSGFISRLYILIHFAFAYQLTHFAPCKHSPHFLDFSKFT